MEVAITKEAIIKALDNTDKEFDMAIIEKLFDKMPTACHYKIINSEFYDNYYSGKYITITDTLANFTFYFNSVNAAIAFIEYIGAERRIYFRYVNTGKKFKKYLINSYEATPNDSLKCML